MIAVDAMGGDSAPSSEVAGAVAAVRELPVEVVLVGDEPRLRAELSRLGRLVPPRVRIRHATQVVTMDDHPAQAFRSKRDSSMRVAFELCKSGEAQAVVSAGNSGAMLGHALFVLGRLPGVERPGIVTVFPTLRGKLVLCDMGANVEVKPSTLAQFAVLGACYDQVVHGHRRPRVGLLSNGSEATKGTALTRAADALLRRAALHPEVGFGYLGYIEGSNLWSGDVDVVATDGFTGNIMLKLGEGMADAFMLMVKRALEGSVRGRLGGALVRPVLGELKRSIDYAETGGALLAGVREVVTICHGRSDVTAIKNAIKLSAGFVRNALPARLGEAIARHRGLWASEDEGDGAGAGAGSDEADGGEAEGQG
ncbi:phosphate acyltransferase PlsX [Haliangium ochraceum]|uniref:Phosphate acyltransferase n=1 Tax=Haliangium ochraceum (strain DSM 14365 / JCM 11303 / SMP-2) TaxID=502025 RepID=D0LYW8_HALO1|nr:phosphate acyltransferase PlsX [Haliangium ochraceum]ACY14438.1 fatty acid/phospholipid synthesis protein PlsX [Haliangium ochraceum DSM 14365]